MLPAIDATPTTPYRPEVLLIFCTDDDKIECKPEFVRACTRTGYGIWIKALLVPAKEALLLITGSEGTRDSRLYSGPACEVYEGTCRALQFRDQRFN